MTTKNLMYTRPDGAQGVGFFIPFAGKYVHSIAWPDSPAERYSVDRLDRMGITVEGMEAIGKDGREYLRSELGWRFLSDDEAAEAQAAVAQQLGVDSGEFFATGPELTGEELEAAKAEYREAETETNDDQLEVEGEAGGEANEQADATNVDVVPDSATVPEPELEAINVYSGGHSPEVVSESTATDEATVESEPETESVPTEATEVTEDEPVSEAQAIRDYLAANPSATNKEVITALREQGIEVSSGQVTREKRRAE